MPLDNRWNEAFPGKAKPTKKEEIGQRMIGGVLTQVGYVLKLGAIPHMYECVQRDSSSVVHSQVFAEVQADDSERMQEVMNETGAEANKRVASRVKDVKAVDVGDLSFMVANMLGLGLNTRGPPPKTTTPAQEGKDGEREAADDEDEDEDDNTDDLGANTFAAAFGLVQSKAKSAIKKTTTPAPPCSSTSPGPRPAVSRISLAASPPPTTTRSLQAASPTSASPSPPAPEGGRREGSGRPRKVVDMQAKEMSLLTELTGEVESLRPKIEILFRLDEEYSSCPKSKRDFKKAQVATIRSMESLQKSIKKFTVKAAAAETTAADEIKGTLAKWKSNLEALDAIIHAVHKESVVLSKFPAMLADVIDAGFQFSASYCNMFWCWLSDETYRLAQMQATIKTNMFRLIRNCLEFDVHGFEHVRCVFTGRHQQQH